MVFGRVALDGTKGKLKMSKKRSMGARSTQRALPNTPVPQSRRFVPSARPYTIGERGE